jgi:kinesin family protein 23
MECDQQTPYYVQIEGIDEDSTYAIFISYVEIYNNTVYDLLEDTLDCGKSKYESLFYKYFEQKLHVIQIKLITLCTNRHLQGKLVREDGRHNMYVHDVVEVEVKSSKEAREIFYKGMCKKRMAFTSLNSDSSHSHSVFTIRVVQVSVKFWPNFSREI